MAVERFGQVEGVLTELRPHLWPGYYVVLEGTGATGKETIADELCEKIVTAFSGISREDVCVTREPGGSEFAELLRPVLKGESKFWPLRMQIDGYNLARGDSLTRIVQPVLERGGVVVQKRNFVSTLVYQGFAGGYGVERTVARSRAYIEEFIPNCIICIERDLRISFEQAKKTRDEFDAYDQDFDFNKRVQVGYARCRELFNCSEWIWVDNADNSLSLEQTVDEIWERLAPLVWDWHTRLSATRGGFVGPGVQ